MFDFIASTAISRRQPVNGHGAAMSAKKSKRDFRDIIFQIDSELSKIQDADILLERILLEARHVVNADAGTIYEKEGDQLVFKYSQNATLENRLPPGEKLPYSNQRIPIDESRVAGYSAKNQVVGLISKTNRANK